MSTDTTTVDKSTRHFGWLALFASTGTLVCCALPIILVTLGFGSVVAAMTSSMPFLITLSQHKIAVFILSAGLLSVAGWMLYGRNTHCPTDPELARRCAQAQRWNRRIWGLGLTLWGIGFIAAFLSLPLRKWLGW
ncbi:hypothetical protein MNBD_GAMMA15-882 [hydrothermal vent metagenome]|uniref:Uncharacterized protein n=1 Tax=hydrothermal vent metagenome TaxID=652676 RepID=A0A3B0YT05_9ZZZZ